VSDAEKESHFFDGGEAAVEKKDPSPLCNLVNKSANAVKPTDAELLAQGQALAKVVKEELAHAQWPETLEEAMQRLRGRLWSS